MTEINLLPWRELRREREKKQLNIYLFTGLITGALIVFLLNYYASSLVSMQTRINQRLTDEINQLNKKIAEIKELKTLRQALVARMGIVKNLQATRPLTVHLFDEIIKVLPDGIYITHVDRVADKVTLLGYAESNTNISQLMRNIEQNEWIQEPELTEIKKNETKETNTMIPEATLNAFKLSFVLKPKTAGQRNEKLQPQ